MSDISEIHLGQLRAEKILRGHAGSECATICGALLTEDISKAALSQRGSWKASEFFS